MLFIEEEYTFTDMKWTQEEDQILKDNHGKLTLNQIKVLLITRPNVKYTTLRARCQKLGLYRNKSIVKLPVKNTYDLEYFKEINEIKAYLGGLIATDGCIMTDEYGGKVFNYGVAEKDECILDLFIKELNIKNIKKSLSLNSFNGIGLKKHRCKSIRLSCFDKNAEYLEKYFNITPRKTYRLGPINITDKNLCLSFIVGTIDGDGYIGAFEDHNQLRLAMSWAGCSEKFLLWIQETMDKYFPYENHKKTISRVYKDKDSNCYLYGISGVRAAIIIDCLRQIPIFKLGRKWENPMVLEYINSKKKQHPHLFKIFIENSLDIPPSSPIISI